MTNILTIGRGETDWKLNAGASFWKEGGSGMDIHRPQLYGLGPFLH